MIKTIMRRESVETEKVPSLTKLAHVASLTLIDQISEMDQFPEFKQRLLTLPKHLRDEIFNAPLSGLRRFQGKELCRSDFLYN